MQLRKELEALGPPMLAEEKEMSLRHQVGSKTQEVQTAQADLEITKAKLTKHAKELKTISGSLSAAHSELAKVESSLQGLVDEIGALQAEADAAEDAIFAKFSKSLGVASVREYEERSLKAAREREAELLALKQQQSKLHAQMLFEKRRDVPTQVATARLEALTGRTLTMPLPRPLLTLPGRPRVGRWPRRARRLRTTTRSSRRSSRSSRRRPRRRMGSRNMPRRPRPMRRRSRRSRSTRRLSSSGCARSFGRWPSRWARPRSAATIPSTPLHWPCAIPSYTHAHVIRRHVACPPH